MKYNFFAGPAILPQEVLKQASESAFKFDSMDLSILEVSHRSKPMVQMMEEAVANVKTLLNISDEYAVLFLTGGASSQFYMTAMNILNDNDTAAYIDTGAWSTKAIKEANAFGTIDLVASSKDRNYNYIPKNIEISKNYRYVHLTSNNTIFGTQYHQWPETNVPFVCDMSSDIFSRALPIERFDLIYAGAQKNLGPAGVTLVIVKKDILGKVERHIPTMLDYQTHINKDSAFNTPPVFPIYVAKLTLDWIVKNGGLSVMEDRNKEKAQLLYQEIDRNGLFEGTTAAEDRSLMNATFVIKNQDLESQFLSVTEEHDLVGLKGHRSVGGFRASIYNAMPKAGVEQLVAVMRDFEAKYG